MYNIGQLNAMDAVLIAGCSERHQQSVIEELIETAKAALAAAPASPQPVARVLSESDIHAIIDSLPESAFEPTIAIGEITALFDDDNGEDMEVLESIKAYAKIVAFRALAASTPTTLTEKKE